MDATRGKQKEHYDTDSRHYFAIISEIILISNYIKIE